MHVDVNGNCHCGAVSFTARVNPDYVVMCHCTDCQTFSSAPYRVSIPVKAENLNLAGPLSTYVKIGGSGAKRINAFCRECGSAVHSTSTDATPEFYNLRWGIIHQRNELPPQKQGFCASSPDWATNISGIREVPT